MPRYILPNGKAVYSEAEVPDNELDDFLSSVGGEEPGLLQRGWNAISEPLTDLPSRAWKPVADWIDAPVNRDDGYLSGAMARGKGFLSGATQGMADLASSLTSPVNIATTIGSMGAAPAANAGLAGVSRGLSAVGKVASAGTAGHGVFSAGNALFDPNASWQDVGSGLVEVGGGIAEMMHVPGAKTKSSGATADIPLPATPVAAKKGPNIVPENINVVRIKKGTPELIKSLKEQGFELEEATAQGFKLRRTNKIEPQPILESEVSLTRPTKSAATNQAIGAERIGPLTDVQNSNPVVEALNLPRALSASIDVSAPLRQGIGLIHKKEFWNAIVPMMKSWASEDAFRALQDEISQRPLFRERIIKGADGVEKIVPSFAEDAGLKLTDLTNLSKREEAIMSTWAEKIPGVRRSNRAYTAFLNKLRADTFDSLVRDSKIIGANGETNLPLARAMADFVNTASGRGSLGRLESSAVALNTMLFSPRLVASRLKMLNPAYYIMAPAPVRNEALKSLLAMAAVGNTITQLGKMAGGEVSMDPSSADFGKLKVGDTRLDTYGGFQQYIVAANRLLNPMGPATGFEGNTPFTRGQMVTSTQGGNREYDLWNRKGPYDPSWADVAGRFARGKLHPTLAFAYSLASGGREMTGEKMNLTSMNPFENAVSQRFIPMVLQDMYEVSKTDPKLLPITVPLSALGMGVQSYPEAQ